MTAIYTVDEENTEDCQHDYTVFDSEDAALRHSCARAMSLISLNWDLSDEDIQDTVQGIERHIKNGKYRTALREFNDAESNRDAPVYLCVNSGHIRGTPDRIDYINWSDYLCEDDEDEEDEEEDEEEEVPYQASHPGAICRGPCKSHSTDAYADQRDGTFLCYQCKLMKQVFGS